MKKYAIIFLVLMFMATSVIAAEVKLPPITEDTLSNGLVVVAIENHELPTVTMRMVVKSGSAYDPAGKSGLADFTASLLRMGTDSKKATEIAKEIDFVGGSLSGSADRDASYIGSEVLLKHLDVAMGLLSDIILHPAFDTSEIERMRQQNISGIIQSKDDPNTICATGFNELLFEDHPYGHPSGGTEKSMAAITKVDITKFYADYYHPNNAFFVVAGDIVPQQIFDAVSSKFGDWKKADIPPLNLQQPPGPKGHTIWLVNKEDATQTQIRFGNFGITRQNPDYYPMTLMNYILGVGFVSRLTEEVRVKGGMTYDIQMQNEWNRMPGAYYVSTFTNNDSTMSAINATLKVMKGMKAALVTDAEYKNAISFYQGYYPMKLETPEQVASEIIKVKLYGLPVSYIQNFTQNISKVTKADILRVAKKYVDTDNLDFCIVSNAAAVQDSLKKIGNVTIKNVDDIM
jgi:zinc protease